jgi:flagellar biosynthesis GTPase FlhF
LFDNRTRLRAAATRVDKGDHNVLASGQLAAIGIRSRHKESVAHLLILAQKLNFLAGSVTMAVILLRAGLAAVLLMATTSGTAQTAPVAGVPAAAATPVAVDAANAQAAAETERKAAEERAREQEKAAEKEREAARDRQEEQEKAARQQREAAEAQAAADKKAAEAAAAQKAAADQAAAAQVAQAAPAAPVAAAAPAVPLSSDPRDRVVQLCTAEAQRRGAAAGATDVSLKDVKDTDVKSDGYASMRATMNLVVKDSRGKLKTSKKSVECVTRNGVVTRFEVD